MKTRKIPERTCVVTREKYPKKELLRIVRSKEGIVEADVTGKKNGRGAYIKADLKTLELTKKNKSLEHALQVEIPSEVYDEIELIIKENNK